MKQQFLLIILNIWTELAFSQTEKGKKRIGISIPVVYNNSSGIYY